MGGGRTGEERRPGLPEGGGHRPQPWKWVLGAPSMKLRPLQALRAICQKEPWGWLGSKRQKHTKAWLHQKWWKGLGACGWALAFSATSFTKKWLLESLCSHSKNELTPQTENREGRAGVFSTEQKTHLCPAMPLRASVQGKVDTQLCPPERRLPPPTLRTGEKPPVDF